MWESSLSSQLFLWLVLLPLVLFVRRTHSYTHIAAAHSCLRGARASLWATETADRPTGKQLITINDTQNYLKTALCCNAIQNQPHIDRKNKQYQNHTTRVRKRHKLTHKRERTQEKKKHTETDEKNETVCAMWNVLPYTNSIIINLSFISALLLLLVFFMTIASLSK